VGSYLYPVETNLTRLHISGSYLDPDGYPLQLPVVELPAGVVVGAQVSLDPDPRLGQALLQRGAVGGQLHSVGVGYAARYNHYLHMV